MRGFLAEFSNNDQFHSQSININRTVNNTAGLESLLFSTSGNNIHTYHLSILNFFYFYGQFQKFLQQYFSFSIISHVCL